MCRQVRKNICIAALNKFLLLFYSLFPSKRNETQKKKYSFLLNLKLQSVVIIWCRVDFMFSYNTCYKDTAYCTIYILCQSFPNLSAVIKLFIFLSFLLWTLKYIPFFSGSLITRHKQS